MDVDRDPPPRRAREEERDRPRRVALISLLLVFAIFVGGIVAIARYYDRCGRPPDGEAEPVSFTVPQGTSGQQVVRDLHDQGLVSCEGFVMDLILRGTGKADGILAGTYDLRRGMTLDQILDVLTTSPPRIPMVKMTIPEGFRITQIAQRVREDLRIPPARFLAALDAPDVALPPYLPASAPSAEGFLFPATYRLPRDDLGPQTVIGEMLRVFEEQAQALRLRAGASRLGLSPYEVVVVASMIEKEARIQRDRPLIAGVIYNRLEAEMPLGIDATLLYDDPTPDGQLSSSDLESDSPYNTRLRLGLPPTPIASPGASSLKAALHPADTPFFYYVLCGANGSHKFAVTFQEHLRNVDACL
jgi:peptidoglycan lytic transglycosylase G